MLPLLASTQFVLILDAAIVGVAMPSMAADLGFAAAGLSWVANAYNPAVRWFPAARRASG